MCLTVQNSLSEVEQIVILLELYFVVPDETACVKKSSCALCFQSQDGPTCHCRVPVVDLVEDG